MHGLLLCKWLVLVQMANGWYVADDVTDYQGVLVLRVQIRTKDWLIDWFIITLWQSAKCRSSLPEQHTYTKDKYTITSIKLNIHKRQIHNNNYRTKHTQKICTVGWLEKHKKFNGVKTYHAVQDYPHHMSQSLLSSFCACCGHKNKILLVWRLFETIWAM